MDRISGALIHSRKIVVIVFLLLTFICAGLYLGVTVNYDLADYLPADAPSTKALAVMEEEFPDGMPNARVMFNNVSINEALEYKDKLDAIDGVSNVIWLDDVFDIRMQIGRANV